VAALASALTREYDVVVAAHGDGFLREAARRAGVRYVPLRHLRRPLDPLHDALALIELFRLFRRERPLVLHANSSKAGVLGRLAAVAARVPVRFFTVHGWAFKAHSGRTAKAYLWADRLMSPLTTTTICVARGERSAGLEARTCRPDRTVVIHNGAALDVPGRTPGGAGPAMLLSVGRMRAPKDFLTLVRAMAALEPGSARLRIAGDGPDHAAVEAEVARLGLEGTVELLGTRGDVPALLADADVFVLASDSEGLPMSVLEAMAARLAVVASAVGGVPELVRDGETGALVPPRDSAALARALAPLVSDAALRDRLGEAGRRRVEREFSLERFEHEHLELYRKRARR
jgi:glycosyltransferase involved in cell wall biosynthesis